MRLCVGEECQCHTLRGLAVIVTEWSPIVLISIVISYYWNRSNNIQSMLRQIVVRLHGYVVALLDSDRIYAWCIRSDGFPSKNC